jgi:hypothetical protein
VLDRLRHLRSRRLVAFLAVAALLFAMTVYGAHVHHPGGKVNETSHCDLCLQFGSTGGPASPPKLIIRVSLVVIRCELPADTNPPLSREQSRSHRSRAPPFTHLI